MGSQEDGCPFLHGLPVEGLADEPGVSQGKGIMHPIVVDGIAVMLADVVMTDAEVFRHFTG